MSKQIELKGVESKSIPELDRLVDDYEEARDERMEATKREVPAKQKLLDAMHKHEVTKYRTADDKIAEIIPEDETVKVKAYKEPSEKKTKKDQD